jgi:hypothetical protein
MGQHEALPHARLLEEVTILKSFPQNLYAVAPTEA